MGDEDLETPSFFVSKCRLIGVKLLDDLLLTGWLVKSCGTLEYYRDTKIPPAVFGRMVARLFDLNARDAPCLDLFFQDRKVILFKQLHKFVGKSPTCFVVVFDNVRLILRLSQCDNRK